MYYAFSGSYSTTEEIIVPSCLSLFPSQQYPCDYCFPTLLIQQAHDSLLQSKQVRLDRFIYIYLYIYIFILLASLILTGYFASQPHFDKKSQINLCEEILGFDILRYIKGAQKKTEVGYGDCHNKI